MNNDNYPLGSQLPFFRDEHDNPRADNVLQKTIMAEINGYPDDPDSDLPQDEPPAAPVKDMSKKRPRHGVKQPMRLDLIDSHTSASDQDEDEEELDQDQAEKKMWDAIHVYVNLGGIPNVVRYMDEFRYTADETVNHLRAIASGMHAQFIKPRKRMEKIQKK